MIGPRPSPLPHVLATVLVACAISPALAQLAPGEATLFRFAVDEDLGMGSALAAGDFDDDGADDLAMGVPGEDVEAVADAGGFSVGLVAVVPGRPLFADGFEIGDTSAWSLTVP